MGTNDPQLYLYLLTYHYNISYNNLLKYSFWKMHTLIENEYIQDALLLQIYVNAVMNTFRLGYNSRY